MQERIGNWFWTSALLLAACGSADDPGSLAKSREALAPGAPTSTASSTSSGGASFLPPAAGHGCWSDADCAAGEACESEHGQYYCAPRHEDKDYYGADAGAPQEDCRHHGEDCYASPAPDAGAYVECDDDGHHGDDDYSDDDKRDEHGDDDRSGSNRGPH